MADVFISHAAEDEDVALPMARALEAAGHSCWYYERDTVPGPPYLLQIGQAIDDAAVVIVVVSAHSIGSSQVTTEVVRAHESGKHFLPVLRGITHVQFQQRQPVWRQAFGAATTVSLTADGGLERVLPSILSGVRAMTSALAAAPFDRSAPSTPPAHPPERRTVAAWLHGRRAPLALSLGVASLAGVALAAAVFLRPDGGGGGDAGDGLKPTVLPGAALNGAGELAIAYTTERNGRPAVLTTRFDGSGTTVLVENPAFDSDLKWSPQSRLAVFTSRTAGNRDVYSLDLASGRLVQLTNHPGDDFEAVWSPDGTIIAFTSIRDGNRDIYLMTPDGSIRSRLTLEAADDFHPAWSPDGSQIAFTSARDGNREVYVMGADGRNPLRLTNHPGDDSQPAWSPLGIEIAFTSLRDGNREIYIMNVDGSGLRRLTNEQADDLQAAWSPDGAALAFVSRRDGHREVYVVRADGTGLRRLSDAPGEKDQPTWIPPR